MLAGLFNLGFISPTRFVFPVSKNSLRSFTRTCLLGWGRMRRFVNPCLPNLATKSLLLGSPAQGGRVFV